MSPQVGSAVPSLLPMNIASAISRNSDVGSNIGISLNVLRIYRTQLMTKSELIRFELLRHPLLCSGITPKEASPPKDEEIALWPSTNGVIPYF